DSQKMFSMFTRLNEPELSCDDQSNASTPAGVSEARLGKASRFHSFCGTIIRRIRRLFLPLIPASRQLPVQMERLVKRYLLSLLVGSLFSFPALTQVPPVSFQRQIAPVLERRCHVCHQTTNSGGGLNLTSYPELLKGGKHGPVLESGKPEDSLLVK